MVVSALKEKYFRLAAKEVIGKTPAITAELDHLETAIIKLTINNDTQSTKK